MPDRMLRSLLALNRTVSMLLSALRAALLVMALADLAIAFLLASDQAALSSPVFRTGLGWLAPAQWAVILGACAVATLIPALRPYGALSTALWFSTWGAALMVSGAPLYAFPLYGQIVFMHILAGLCQLFVKRGHREPTKRAT